MKHKISEWLNDNFENIQDTCEMQKDRLKEIYPQYHVIFYNTVKKQAFEKFRTQILEDCAKQTGESYEDCNNELHKKLEKLWNLK